MKLSICPLLLLLVAILPSVAQATDSSPLLRGQAQTSPRKLQQQSVVFVGNNGDWDAPYPLEHCRGDCDDDSDCEGELVCFQREGPNVAVPTCLGGEEDVTDNDYCMSTSPAPTLAPVPPSPSPTTELDKIIEVIPAPWDNDNTTTTMATLLVTGNLLDQCQGPCRTDDDCQDGLLCYRRTLQEPVVPYCVFEDADAVQIARAPGLLQFCTLPPQPTPAPTVSPTYGIALAVYVGDDLDEPLNHCEGDCDEDSDCQGEDFICYQRDGDDEVPGCYFDEDAGGFDIDESYDVCMHKSYTEAPTKSPTNRPTPQPTPWITEAPAPAPRLAKFVGNPAENLGRCEGDCDSDSDCQGNLVCYSRGDDDEAPGCYFNTDAGGADQEEDDDFCVDRRSIRTNPRLRLYWEEGYYWQEDSSEFFMCMVNDERTAKVERCSSGSSRQRFEVKYLPSGEAMIKSQNDGRCLEGNKFETCDESEIDQRWNPKEGSWIGPWFELSNRDDDSECLSPHHHPRDPETCYMLSCREERRYTTNRWQFYW